MENLINFIKDNKFLSLIMLFALVLIIIVMTSSVGFRQSNLQDGYTNDLRLFQIGNDYYVESRDPNKTKPEEIRTILNIPKEIEFEVVKFALTDNSEKIPIDLNDQSNLSNP